MGLGPVWMGPIWSGPICPGPIWQDTIPYWLIAPIKIIFLINYLLSGWEDHFQSDQFHYLHHRFFECNYGNSRIPLDKMFGTFRDKLKETGTTYSGGSEEATDAKSAAIHDSKATLKGFPDLGFCIYMGLK